MIYKLRSFGCPLFQCYFHLWGFGGPAWIREYNSWLYELDHEWTLVTRSPRRILSSAKSISIGRRAPSATSPILANQPAPISVHGPALGVVVAVEISNPSLGTTT